MLGIVAAALPTILSTPWARGQVAQVMTDKLGVPVELKSLKVGWTTVNLHLAIPTVSDDGEFPDLIDSKVAMDVGIVGLARGRLPEKVQITSPRLFIRLDADGLPIDKLPQLELDDDDTAGELKLPTVVANDISVEIQQQGKPEFRIGKIQVELTPDIQTAGRLNLIGDVYDPDWGNWSISGSADLEPISAEVVLLSEGNIKADMERLKSIPFVPDEVWEEVAIVGEANGSVRLGYADDDITWRVEMNTVGSKVDVPVIDLTLDNAAGKLIVEGAIVRLVDARGETADGQVFCNATLNFDLDEPVLEFQVRAEGMDVQKLPAMWGMPKQIEGKMRGQADLRLTLRNGTVEPYGSGHGVLENAVVAGFPAELMEVKLKGDGKTYTFETEVMDDKPKKPRPGSEAFPTFWPLIALALSQVDAPWADKILGRGKPEDGPSRIQVNLKLRDIDLGELIERLEVPVPLPISGQMTVAVNAGLPLDKDAGLKDFTLQGTVELATFHLGDFFLENTTANINFTEGRLALESFRTELRDPSKPNEPPGFATGSAALGIEPASDLTANLKLESVPLSQIFQIAPELKGKADGPVSGYLTLTLAEGMFENIQAAVAEGQLNSPALTVMDRKVEDTFLKLELRDGIARLSEAKTVIENLPVTANAQVQLDLDSFPYQFSLRTDGTEPVDIRQLAPEAELPFDMAGRIAVTASSRGQLVPFEPKIVGRAEAYELSVATSRISTVKFDWELSQEELVVSKLTAEAYRGGIEARLTLPFVDSKNSNVEIKLSDIDATALSRDLPNLPVRIEGRVAGSLGGGIPGIGPNPEPLEITMQSPNLRLDGIPARSLRGKANQEPDGIRYDLTAEVLGGSMVIDGKYPWIPGTDIGPAVPKEDKAEDTDQADEQGCDEDEEFEIPEIEAVVFRQDDDKPVGPEGQIRLTGAQLERIAEELRYEEFRNLRGRVDVVLRYSFDAVTGMPVGGGEVRLTDLRWTGSGESAEVTANVRLFSEGLEVNQISGRVLGGEIRGRARVLYGLARGSFFNIAINRANMQRLLNVAGISGTGGATSLALRGTIGREYRGTGTLVLSRGRYFDVPIQDGRIPFDWAFNPAFGGRISLRDVTVRAAGGRLNARGEYQFGLINRLDTRVQFSEVSVRELVGRVGGVSPGRATGRLELRGNNMRSVNDLNGTLNAKLGQTSLTDTPVFRALVPYLYATRIFTPFDEGEVRARLSRGQIRVERFTLTGPTVQMFVEGRVALSGKLDLDVTAQTSQIGIDSPLLRLLQVRIIPAGPLPINILLEATRLLSNRLVRLKVTGTINKPIVRIDTLGLLAEETIRYFLGTYDLTNP